MRLEFGFGTGTQSVEVCDDRLAGILHANEPPPGLTGEDAVRAALDAPIGGPPIEQVVRPNEKIAIVRLACRGHRSSHRRLRGLSVQQPGT